MGSIGGGGGGEQQYSLRWNDFHSSILSSFRHLRDQEDFVDVTLACDGCSFTAHKVVLSACSPYFRSLLKANPCQHPIVILRDVKEQDMEALLRFMYNGEVHIGQEHLADFLKTAQTLQVRGLADVPSKEQEKLLNNSGGMSWPSRDHMSAGLDGDSPDGGLSPPRAKRSRSQEHPPLYSPNPQHSNQDQTILSHALDPTNNNTVINNNNQLKGSDSSLAAQSTGEESNSSDTAMSCSGGDRGELVPKSEPQDYSPHGTPLAASGHPHGPLAPDSSRHSNSTPQHNFPAALLGLQGLPGLLPGPSGMHNSQENSFGRGYVCPLCGRGLPDLTQTRQHLDLHYPRDSPACPVPSCARLFTHPNSVRNHMREKHPVIWSQMKSLKWTHALP